MTTFNPTGRYYDDMADVEVTFHDGEVKTYRIGASPSISGYLARKSAETGVLDLYNNHESHGIPIANVREFTLRSVPVENDEPEEPKDERNPT